MASDRIGCGLGDFRTVLLDPAASTVGRRRAVGLADLGVGRVAAAAQRIRSDAIWCARCIRAGTLAALALYHVGGGNRAFHDMVYAEPNRPFLTQTGYLSSSASLQA